MLRFARFSIPAVNIVCFVDNESDRSSLMRASFAAEISVGFRSRNLARKPSARNTN
jgi:hypothetical protein